MSDFVSAAPPAVGVAQDARGQRSITLRLDFAGAEAVLGAMAKSAITDAEIEALLRVRGVRAMVDNVKRFVPTATDADFASALKQHVQTGTASHESSFRLGVVHSKRAEILDLISRMHSREAAIVEEATRALGTYVPPGLGAVELKAYIVVGGVSDGFVFDNDPENAVFVAVDVARGDQLSVASNITHELYHRLQKLASDRVEVWKDYNADERRVFDAERLLLTAIREGTANIVSDPLKLEGTGPYLEMWRNRFLYNQRPERIRENFALFERTLHGLHSGTTLWEDAYRAGFSGSQGVEGNQFYFVGYEIGRALERQGGPQRIGRAFTESPFKFFVDYLDLSRRDSSIQARFSAQTEALLRTLADGKADRKAMAARDARAREMSEQRKASADAFMKLYRAKDYGAAVPAMDALFASDPAAEFVYGVNRFRALSTYDPPAAIAYARKLADGVYEDRADRLNTLAWFLVVEGGSFAAPDTKLAIELAERAVGLAHPADALKAQALDTLAYAYDRGGDLDKAIATQERAVRAAEAIVGYDKEGLEALRKQLETFRTKKRGAPRA